MILRDHNSCCIMAILQSMKLIWFERDKNNVLPAGAVPPAY